MPQSTLFKVHKLNAVGLQKAGELADAFSQLLSKLEEICPEGREFSLVKTKLEEASFFAKKSMAMNPEHQELPFDAEEATHGNQR